jgi:hypothetical protein
MAPPSLEMVGLTADEVKNLPDSEAKPPIPPKPSTPTLSFMAARPFRNLIQIVILYFYLTHLQFIILKHLLANPKFWDKGCVLSDEVSSQ